MPLLGEIFFETMQGNLLEAMQAASLSDVQKERISLEGELSLVKQRKKKLLELGGLDDEDIAEAFAREKSEEGRLGLALSALPVTDDQVGIDPLAYYERINGDPVALTKTLQLGDTVLCVVLTPPCVLGMRSFHT